MFRSVSNLFRLRYSLRSLLMVVTLLCLLVGWFTSRMQQAGRQATAAKMLQAGGVFVGYDYMLDKDGQYTANYRVPTGFLRRCLGNDFFSEVGRVEYPPGELPDCGVTPLANIWGLRHLLLRGTKIGDSDFRLDRFAKLQTLDVAYTDITDATMGRLATLTRLQSLDISGTPITDAALQTIRRLPTLKNLIVNDAALSQQAVQQLKKDAPSLNVQWNKAPSRTHLVALRKLTQLGAVVDLINEEQATDERDSFSCPGYRVTINGDRSIENHWKGVETDLALIEHIEGLSMLELNRLSLTPTSLLWLANVSTLRALTLESVWLHEFAMPMNYQFLHVSLRGTPIPFPYQDYISIPLLHSLLDSLAVLHFDIGDGALMVTLGRLEKLEQIVFDRTRVSDRGIAELGRLKSLRRLGLRATEITDAGVATVATIKSIEELDLSFTVVHDLGLAKLRGMPKLRKVVLGGSFISDKGLEYLADIPSLQDLQLIVDVRNRVTNSGIRRLQTQRPELHITRTSE